MENKPFEPKHSYSGMNQPPQIRKELTMIQDTVLALRSEVSYQGTAEPF